LAYAWAPIRYGAEKDDQGVITSTLVRKVGEEVSQGDIDASDEDWAYLVNNGVVREQEYPVEDLSGSVIESPREVMLRKAKEMMAEAESLATQAGTETPTGTAAERSGLNPAAGPGKEAL
jgi:hypothetical protein